MIYLFVLFLLLCLSVRYDINLRTRGKNQWFFAMLIIFIMIAGLRWRVGIDTTRYLYAFYFLRPSFENFSFADYPIGKDPLWVLLNSFVKSFAGRFYVVQLVHAAIVNTLIFYYIRRHCKYVFICLFFYALTDFLNYNMEVMRGSISIVICLYANDYFLEKKWVKGFSLLLLALMFHAQTIVIFCMPFLLFMRLNKIGLIMLILGFIAGMLAEYLIGDYALYLIDNEAIQEKALGYIESEHYGSEFGLMPIITNFIPNLLYALGSLWFIKTRNTQSSVLRFEPLVLFFCLFLMIKINFRIAYRYVDYYQIYVLFFYSETFVRLVKRFRFRRNYAFAILIFIPLLIMRVNYFSKDSVYSRYFPYTSIFYRETDRDRESLFVSLGGRAPNKDIY